MKLLFCFLFLITFQNQIHADKRRISISVQSITLDEKNKDYINDYFILDIKFKNIGKDTIKMGDTLLVYTNFKDEKYIMAQIRVSDSFLAPQKVWSCKSMYTLSSKNGLFRPVIQNIYYTDANSIFIDETSKYIDGRFYINNYEIHNKGKFDSCRNNLKCIANYNTLKLHNQIEELMDANSTLEIEHFSISISNQLKFKYKSISEGNYHYTITDNLGKVVARGFLDIKRGENEYAIDTINFKSGRYTLKVGDSSHALYGNFTII